MLICIDTPARVARWWDRLTVRQKQVLRRLAAREERGEMAGICSAHRERDPDCPLCATDIREVLPDYDAMVAEAEAAGRVQCQCGFVYYRTTTTCPRCGKGGGAGESMRGIHLIRHLTPGERHSLAHRLWEWLRFGGRDS